MSWSTTALPALWLLGTLVIVPLVLAQPAPPGTQARGAAGDAGAAGADTQGWEVLDRHPGGGEQCLVCSQAIEGETAVAIRYKGRVFHVKESMMEEFRQDPDAYFRKLQARSGLFDEEAVGTGPVRAAWLAVGVYVVVGLVCGALCVGLALRRGSPPLVWFFAGLVGNVVALAALALASPAPDEGRELPPGLRKIPSTRAPLACPRCGSGNHPSAATCTTCGAPLVPEVSAETARIEGRPA